MTRREENKAVLRKRLLEEARKLFSVNGFEQTTVADIVAATGIGRGTFYNYFSDVKDIFDGVLDEINSEIRVLIRKHVKNRPVLMIYYMVLLKLILIMFLMKNKRRSI